MNKIIATIIGASILSLIISPMSIQEANAETLYNYKLMTWINKLSFQESTNRENIVIVDSNGKKSYGCLQFQASTFVEQSKKYNITGKLMSCQFQKELAIAMIKDNPQNARHWYTSVKKIGKPPVYSKTA